MQIFFLSFNKPEPYIRNEEVMMPNGALQFYEDSYAKLIYKEIGKIERAFDLVIG